MKLRLPKLLLLAVMTAGVSNVYAANGWGHYPGDVYYIDNENSQSIDATGQTYTTWKIWSDTASSDNSPTNTTITSLKFKNGDTAIIELGTWENSRNFDTITFDDVSIADNGTATLNVAEDNKAAIVNVSGGTISSTVDGSLSVTGQVAMNNLTLNGTLTNTGTLSANNLSFGGYTINNTGGSITINTNISIDSLGKTTLEGSFTEDESNGYFSGSHVLISGGDISIAQGILDANSALNYDAEKQKLTYTTGETGTIYYINTIEKEYDAGDNWNGATGFIIGSQGTLKLSAALASTMTDGITVSETGAKIKVENGVTLSHSTVSVESGQKVSYEIDGAKLDIDLTATNISAIDLKNSSKVTLNKADSSLGSGTSKVQINMSGDSALALSNGSWGKVYADINVEGAAKIQGSWQGNSLDVQGTIKGKGTLTLGRPETDRWNTWTISSVISNKSENEVLSLLVEDGTKVILKGDNTYTGGTTVTSGTLYASHQNALGNGSVTVNGGNLVIGTVGFNDAGGTTIAEGNYANAIEGEELNITNGSVKAYHNPGNADSSVIGKGTKININTGGTLHLEGHDMLGWENGPEIALGSTSSESKATLHIADSSSNTFSSKVTMSGNAQITGNNFNTFGTTLTVTGTGNEVSVGTIAMRTQGNLYSWDIDVAQGGELTLSGKITNHNSEAATLNKSNEGKLIVTGTESTWTGLMNVTGGTLQLKDNATLGDASIMIGSAATLEAGKGTINSLTLSDGATLKADAAVNMGGALTLGTNLTLNGSLLTALNSLTAGQTIDLFTSVETLTLGKDTYAKGTVLDEASGIDLSIYFSLPTTYTAAVYNAEAFGNSYYLGYNADGTIYAGMAAIPEPTTATLSLLALAALASRRRRK